MTINISDIITPIFEETSDQTFEEINFYLRVLPNIILNEYLMEGKVIAPEQVKRMKAPDDATKEEKALYKDIRKASFGIEVDRDGLTKRGFKEDPYYKVFIDASNFKAAKPKNRVRISIKNNEYSSHNSKDTAGLCLNADLKDKLDLILKTKIQSDKEYIFKDGKKVETYYDLILYNANLEGDMNDPQDPYYLHKVEIEDIPSVKGLPDELPK